MRFLLIIVVCFVLFPLRTFSIVVKDMDLPNPIAQPIKSFSVLSRSGNYLLTKITDKNKQQHLIRYSLDPSDKKVDHVILPKRFLHVIKALPADKLGNSFLVFSYFSEMYIGAEYLVFGKECITFKNHRYPHGAQIHSLMLKTDHWMLVFNQLTRTVYKISGDMNLQFKFPQNTDLNKVKCSKSGDTIAICQPQSIWVKHKFDEPIIKKLPDYYEDLERILHISENGQKILCKMRHRQQTIYGYFEGNNFHIIKDFPAVCELYSDVKQNKYINLIYPVCDSDFYFLGTDESSTVWHFSFNNIPHLKKVCYLPKTLSLNSSIQKHNFKFIDSGYYPPIVFYPYFLRRDSHHWENLEYSQLPPGYYFYNPDLYPNKKIKVLTSPYISLEPDTIISGLLIHRKTHQFKIYVGYLGGIYSAKGLQKPSSGIQNIYTLKKQDSYIFPNCTGVSNCKKQLLGNICYSGTKEEKYRDSKLLPAYWKLEESENNKQWVPFVLPALKDFKTGEIVCSNRQKYVGQFLVEKIKTRKRLIKQTFIYDAEKKEYHFIPHRTHEISSSEFVFISELNNVIAGCVDSIPAIYMLNEQEKKRLTYLPTPKNYQKAKITCISSFATTIGGNIGGNPYLWIKNKSDRYRIISLQEALKKMGLKLPESYDTFKVVKLFKCEKQMIISAQQGPVTDYFHVILPTSLDVLIE